jgi:DNA gyrase/topoisomerase IV subunit A
MVVIREVLETDDIVVVTQGGMVIRQHASDVRMAGRNTQGVRLIRLQDEDSVADVAVVVAEEEEENKIAQESDKAGEGKGGGEKGKEKINDPNIPNPQTPNKAPNPRTQKTNPAKQTLEAKHSPSKAKSKTPTKKPAVKRKKGGKK